LAVRVLIQASLAAATIAVLTAGPASAQAPANANNCYGATQSDAVAGPGGNPGTTNGQVTSGVARTSGADKRNALADFQQNFREEHASCGGTGKP
jgi:hypothetical protein